MKNNFSQKTNLPTTNRSLKAILKTREPLSKYINQKIQSGNQGKRQYTSYFQKLKGMIQNNRIPEQQQFRKSQFLPSSRIICQTQENMNRQRSVSVKCRIRDISPLTRKEKRKNQIQKISKIKQEIMEQMKPLQTQGAIQFKKQMKKQIFDYKKFKQHINNYQRIQKIQLSSVLGSGANASVRIGKAKDFGNLAVKIYQKYKLIEESKKKRVYKQIKILERLHHKNIISLIQAYQDKRQIHLVFEYIDSSMTLQDLFRKSVLCFPERDLRRILKQLVQGVAYIHSEGIAHRDIKPENILVSESQLKIIDFGFATSNDLAELHCGTPSFMAPQLFTRNKAYCPFKVDIWALGVIMFYLSQSSFPFKGYNEKDLARNIRSGQFKFNKSPLGLREPILRCLDNQPENRINAHQILAYPWFQF